MYHNKVENRVLEALMRFYHHQFFIFSNQGKRRQVNQNNLQRSVQGSQKLMKTNLRS